MGDIGWMDVAGTAIVLLVAGGIVGAMVWMIRISTDDSGKHAELQAFMQTLFETPAHLRPGSPADSGSGDPSAAHSAESDLAIRHSHPFEEHCPACSEPVTHEHASCPSCELRLQ